jgi:hypothetical protein
MMADEILKDVIELPAAEGATDEKAAPTEQPAAENKGGLPAGVIRELQESRRERRELREALTKVTAQLASQPTGGADKYADLRGMSESELDDLAGESEADKARVRAWRVAREDERVTRSAQETVKILDQRQTSQTLATVQGAFQTLAEHNDWLTEEDNPARLLFEAAYNKAREIGNDPQQSMRRALRTVAPTVKANGLTIKGLHLVDPEFARSVVGGTVPNPKGLPSTVADLPGGQAPRGRSGMPPATAGAPNEVLVKAYEDMEPDEREEWLQSDE